jgi:hypothetical protein
METPSLQSRHAAFAGWVSMAVFLHALLLLIPAQQGLTPGPAAKSLALVLTRAWQPAPGTAEPAPGTAKPAPGTAKMDRTPAEMEPLPSPPEARSAPEPPVLYTPGRPEAEEPRLAAPTREDAPPPNAGSPEQAVTAARLLDLANPRDWRLPGESEARRPGDLAPPALRPNWRPGTGLGPSRFDGRALPERVEIVDRWLATDGSHNVMIETPTGEILCGRAAAWDPMQPLVEHVMMYRSCGRARSTFEWPEHYGGAAAKRR